MSESQSKVQREPMGVSFEPILHPNKCAYTRFCLRFLSATNVLFVKSSVKKSVCGKSPKATKGAKSSFIARLQKSTIGRLLNTLAPNALNALAPKIALHLSGEMA